MSSEQQNQASRPEAPSTGILTDSVAEFACESCGCMMDVTGLEPFIGIECPDCHAQQTVPAKLGNFVLQHLIGTGGMGGVYVAKDETLGRQVAIKVMLESLGKDKQLIETFRKEAQAVAKLNHPNIAQIYSFGMEKGQPYIVMELVNGDRLDRLISSGQQLDEGLVMKIGLEIAEALSAADEIGLIHGDIKPENILLDEKWKAKLVDFGLAHFRGQAQEQGIWGTPYYIAPEKVRRQKVDARSDIYSLGATLYHALAGKPPFDGATPIEVVKARLEKDPKPLGSLRTGLNSRVGQIVMRMLENMPAKRYPTYSSLIGDLRDIVKFLGADRKDFAGLSKKTVKLFISKKATSPLTTSTGSISTTGASGDGVSVPTESPEEQIKPGSIRIARKRVPSLTISAGMTKSKGELASRKDSQHVETDASSLESYKKKQHEVAKQRPGKPMPKSVFLLPLLILVIAAAAGISAVIKQKQKQRAQAAAEYQQRQTGIKAAEDAFARIHAGVTNIVVFELKAKTMQDNASNAVMTLLGERLTLEAPPAPAVPAPAEPKPQKVESKPEKQEEKPKDPAPAAVPAAASAVDEKGREAPLGMMTREQLDAMRKKEEQKKTPPAEQPKTEQPKDESQKPAQPPQPPPILPPAEPELKTLARKVLENSSKILQMAQSARETETSALDLKKQTIIAPTSDEVWAGVTKLNASLASVSNWCVEAGEAMLATDKACAEMNVAKAKLEKEREEKKRREDQTQAEQEKKRQEEERKAMVQAELQLVEQVKLNVLALVPQNKFKEAADDLASQLSNFKTDEGKDAINTLIDKCTRMKALKTFVVGHLEKGFSWGYYDAAVRSPVDVTGADETEIKLGTKKTVQWISISTAQMRKFIDHALAFEKPSRIVQAEYNLAAAIYCEMNGDAKSAKPYVDKALESDLSPAFREKVGKLLPNL